MWERGLKLDKHSTRKEKCINEEKQDKPEKIIPRRNREPEQNYVRPERLLRKDKIQNPSKEINMNNNNDFPHLNKVKEKDEEKTPTNFYAEMCKKTSEEDEKRKKENFQPGCVGFKYDKKTHETTYTRDGINYYSMEKYREECEIEEEKRNMERWIQSLNEMEQRYEAESRLHFELYGELDGYAIAKIEHAEYEEYAKQFEMNETEEYGDDSDYEEDYDSEISLDN